MTFASKSDVDKFTRKLYKFLSNGHKIKFKHMRSTRGIIFDYTAAKSTVHLDPRDEIIPTLIHETLHYFYPDASESWILRTESKIISKLTPRQTRNILRRLADSIQ